MRRRGAASGGDSALLAGWLFADLLLALFVIVLAATPGDPSAARATEDSTTTTTTTTTTLPPAPKGISTVPNVVEVNVNRAAFVAGDPGERARVADEVRARLAEQGLAGRRAGLVLSFGGGNAGVSLARSFNEMLGASFPVEFGAGDSRGAIFRDYKEDARPAESVKSEIFFYA